jgi:thioredoxin 1
MNNATRIGIIAILLGGVALAVVMKQMTPSTLPAAHDPATETAPQPPPEVSSAPDPRPAQPAPQTEAPKKLPRLVDLGADKCIPCKMMAPILEEMKKQYAGKLDVEFIDVWKNKEAADTYNINLIPTQIFFDDAGKERFRHEGFFSKEDILAKWKEFGVDLPSPGGSAQGAGPSPQGTSE